MTNLAQAFLAGAALSVLAADPSPAQAPLAPQLKMHSGTYHSKTNIPDGRNSGVTSTFSTETITFSGTFPEAQLYKKWVELWELSALDCKHEKAKFPKKTRVAKLKLVTTASNYELFYKLESTTAESDSFSGEISRHHCNGNYNPKLLINTDLNISH
jgi:hypothetical protein